MATPFRLGYRRELDGLRAVAVVPVMAGHSALIGSGADLAGPQIAGLPGFSGGLYGVDIFFVLSGFLITSILAQEHAAWGTIDFRAFYVRRALRLGPAMVLALAGCALFLLLHGGPAGKFDWLAILYSALYVSNFALIFGGLRLGMLTPTWSLSVEEQFYSIWPFVMSRLLPQSRAAIVKLILGGIVATWVLRAGLHWSAWKFYSWPLFGAANHLIFARADGLLCGALVALVAHWGLLPDAARYARPLKALGWLCAAILAGILHYGPGLIEGGVYGPAIFYFWYACVSVTTALLIVVLLTAPPRWLAGMLRLAPMVWIGRISYGLYLYHMPIYALTPAPAFPGHGALVFGLGAAFLAATLSYYLVEKRFLALRGTWGQPRSLRLAGAARTGESRTLAVASPVGPRD